MAEAGLNPGWLLQHITSHPQGGGVAVGAGCSGAFLFFFALSGAEWALMV